MRTALVLCCFLLAAPACSSTAPAPAEPAQPGEPAKPAISAEPAQPAIVKQLIARQKAEPKKNPPGKVWQYTYRGQTVYYVPPSCCDIPGELFASDGASMCEPDGGITGRGDGKCADFFDVRTDEKLLWADTR